MQSDSPRSLRRAYVDWVEEQVENFKDEIPRSELLRMADEVVRELRMTDAGQYQLTEILMCQAMDKRIARMLKLPGYRAWSAARRAALSAPLFPPDLTPPPPPALVPRTADPLSCVG
jgi:hypothetical protein